jgi:hypothetical protein
MGRRRKKGKGYGEMRRRLKTVEKGNETVKKEVKKDNGEGVGKWERRMRERLRKGMGK